MTAHLTQDEAELVARLRASGTRDARCGGGVYMSICDMAADAISRIAEEREESRVGYARLMNRISEIREASGLGAKPMLDELPAAIGQIAEERIEAQATNREVLGDFALTAFDLQAAEAALSQMKEALDVATFVPWLRDWCKGRFGKWITHNTAKGALLDLQARALAQQPDKEGML